MPKRVWRGGRHPVEVIKRPSEGSKCLLLFKKIEKVSRLKSLTFQRYKVGVSMKHPIVADILAYMPSLGWLHGGVNW